MKSKRWYVCTVVIAVLLFCLAAMVPRVTAEEQPAGFTVSPAQLSLTVSPEVSSQSATVTIENSYDAELRLVAELRAIDESGIRLIPAGPVDEALAAVLKLSATDITVPARGSYQLQVRITDGGQLTDGGHYASLVLSQRPTTGVASTFRPAVAVNVFIIKNQNIRTNLQLTGLKANRTIFSLPSSASATFKNLGNTHVVPRGSISLYDGQTLVGKAVINTDSQFLLPSRQAEFTASFEAYGRLLLPRKLRMQTMYRIDTADVQLVREQTFWYVPVIDVIAVIGIALVIWWRRRQIGHLLRKMKLTRAKTGRQKRSVAGAKSSKSRMIGRTAIRTHRTATLQAVRVKASEVLGPSAVPQTKRIPVQRPIVITVADDTTTTPPSPARSATSAKATKTPKTAKAPSKQPKKTAKKPAKPSLKTTTAKTTKAKAKTATAKVSGTSKKTAAKTTRKKTA